MKKWPILILHGWNLHAQKFQPLVNEFKKNGYFVEAIDLPGFGQSQLPKKPLYLSDYVDYVTEYIKGKKWQKVILIGHSFGGRISIKLAAKNPSYLEALILTGAPGFNPVPRIKALFFFTLAKLGNVLFSLPPLSNLHGFTRHFLYRAAGAIDYYTTNIHMQDTFKNIVSENLEDSLSNINIPTLLLWGENDRIVPFSIAQKMRHVIPNAQLISIADARHGVPWTHPKIFIQEVDKFLKNL